MNVSPFKNSDLSEIEVQPAQVLEHARGIHIAEQLPDHPAFTAREDGRIVAIAGVIPLDRDVGLLWALIAKDTGRHMIRMHRMASRLLELVGKQRVLALASCDFAAGCRWLELLGFRKSNADDDKLDPLFEGGSSYWVYVRAI